jgi:hypothetical protein
MVNIFFCRPIIWCSHLRRRQRVTLLDLDLPFYLPACLVCFTFLALYCSRETQMWYREVKPSNPSWLASDFQVSGCTIAANWCRLAFSSPFLLVPWALSTRLTYKTRCKPILFSSLWILYHLKLPWRFAGSFRCTTLDLLSVHLPPL